MILTEPGLMEGLRVPGGFLRNEGVLGEAKLTDKDIEELGLSLFDPEWERDLSPEGHRLAEDWGETLQDRFAVLWTRVLQKAEEEVPYATPVGLSEALKVRVITKGPPFRQFVLKSMWKHVHTVLRRHPTFRLIGEPVSDLIITEGLGSKLREGELYLSGDYSAATDNLKSWVSETIADQLSEQLELSDLEAKLLRESLTGHLLTTDSGAQPANAQPQRRGQLMGSITSFPILCIANAAMTRLALELGLRRQTGRFRYKLLRDLPILINGDDVVARTTRYGFEAWKKITAIGGLTWSPGKTYVSPEFCELNSQRFLREEGRTVTTLDRSGLREVTRACPFVHVPYVNMGLLLGQTRSGAPLSREDVIGSAQGRSLGSCYRDLINAAPEEVRVKVHKAFVENNKEALESLRPIPWYVPEWLGGVGLTGVEEPSTLDRKIARMILLNWRKTQPRTVQNTQAEWLTWELASRRMPEAYWSSTKDYHGVSEYRDLGAAYCLNVLFDSNVPLGKLHKLTGGKSTKRAIRHNQRLWTPSTYPHISGEAMSLDDMQFRPRYSSLSRPPKNLTGRGQ